MRRVVCGIGHRKPERLRRGAVSGLGHLHEAQEEFERAASLTRNGSERKLLLDRATACALGH